MRLSRSGERENLGFQSIFCRIAALLSFADKDMNPFFKLRHYPFFQVVYAQFPSCSCSISFGGNLLSSSARETCRHPEAKCNTFLQREIQAFSVESRFVAKTFDAVEKGHEVAFANSAKRQNALGATSRKH